MSLNGGVFIFESLQGCQNIKWIIGDIQQGELYRKLHRGNGGVL